MCLTVDEYHFQYLYKESLSIVVVVTFTPGASCLNHPLLANVSLYGRTGLFFSSGGAPLTAILPP